MSERRIEKVEVAAGPAAFDETATSDESAAAKAPATPGEAAPSGEGEVAPSCEAAAPSGAATFEHPNTAPARKRLIAPAPINEAVRHSMQGNKRANTKPELVMRERLREAGLTGYRLQWKVPGHPDIAWPGKKVAVFVNGCFWHRCPHCKPSTPKSHVEYWTVKFDRNVERDRENIDALVETGWKVHVVWECQLKKKTIEATMESLLPELANELGKPLRISGE